MSEYFFGDAELENEVLEPGKLSRTIRARGGRLMMVEVLFEAGAEGKEHEHPHDQVSYCLEGVFVFTVGTESRTLLPGDSVFIPGGAKHGTVCKRRGRLLDTFTPQREDFLKK